MRTPFGLDHDANGITLTVQSGDIFGLLAPQWRGENDRHYHAGQPHLLPAMGNFVASVYGIWGHY